MGPPGAGMPPPGLISPPGFGRLHGPPGEDHAGAHVFSQTMTNSSSSNGHGPHMQVSSLFGYCATLQGLSVYLSYIDVIEPAYRSYICKVAAHIMLYGSL